MSEEREDYEAPGIQPPSVLSLKESAARIGLQLSEEQLKQYAGTVERH